MNIQNNSEVMDYGLINSINFNDKSEYLHSLGEDMNMYNFNVLDTIQNILITKPIMFVTEDVVIQHINYTAIERKINVTKPSENILEEMSNQIFDIVVVDSANDTRKLDSDFESDVEVEKNLDLLVNVVNKMTELPFEKYMVSENLRSENIIHLFDTYRTTVTPIVEIPFEETEEYKQKILKLEEEQKNKSDVQLIRESNGIEVWEIADKLGKTATQYKYFENKQGRKESKMYEKAIELTYKAISEITKDRDAKKNKAFSSMKPNSKGVLEEVLVYKPFTEKIFQDAVRCIKYDRMNIIKTAMYLEICDAELKTRLENSEHFHLVDLQENY